MLVCYSRTLLAVSASLWLGGCGADSASPEIAVTMALVSGDDQVGRVGEELPQPLVVRVTTLEGRGAADVSVSWSVDAGDGWLTPTSDVTDEDGLSSISWHLGRQASAAQTASATVPGTSQSTVTFSATATPGPPASLAMIQGDSQVAWVGSQLPLPYSVSVADRYGNAVRGVVVDWTAQVGGGSMSTDTSRTGPSGIASAVRILGPSMGLQSATASLPSHSGSLVTFTAFANDTIDIDRSDGIQVLFIGNSLTYVNDLPGMLGVLIDSAGAGPVTIASVAFGNWGLQDHWEQGPARATIAQGSWDVVALQQGPSATEGRPSLLEYSALFAEEIEQVGALPALYMVWPDSIRFFDFDGVSDSYRTAAEQVDGLLFPVGEAWRVAWSLSSTIELYGVDGFHPSIEGTYLAALVMFEQLTARTPVGLPSAFYVSSSSLTVNVSPDNAATLQQAATEANTRFARQ